MEAETARALTAAGAEVTLAVRNTEAGAKTAGDITATTGNAAVHVAQLELADPRSVAAFVANWAGPLDVAATSVLVATSPQLEGIGGRYFQDCNEAPVVDPASAESSGSGVASYALDPTQAERLWELSQRV